MDRRGGCCTAPAPVSDDMASYIMLRYRPIAPKPAAPRSVPADPAVPECRRGSQRKTRSNGNSKTAGKCCKKAKAAPEEDAQKAESCCSSVSCVERDAPRAVVTLPLLPERRESPASGVKFGCHVTGHVQGLGAVGTWVVVVEDARSGGMWGPPDGWALGRTDKERATNLARDTCPGFLSDGLNRVTWANAAYWELVGHSGGAAVVMGEDVRVPPSTAAAFTCRVRVVTCGGKCRVLWCDVWRMDGGGFAWRLDTEVALTLGLDNTRR